MARRHARLAALMLIAACEAPGRVSPRVTPGQGSAWSAVALDAEVTRLAATRRSTDALWPGFDPRSIPLAVYDGERT